MKIRTILVLLAAGWAWFAYGLNYDLGYVKSSGSPSIETSLLWAGIASFPIWLGIFVAASRQGVPRVLRWLCVGWLGLETGYLVYLLGGAILFTWLNLLVWPPLLSMALLLWPDIRGERN